MSLIELHLEVVAQLPVILRINVRMNSLGEYIDLNQYMQSTYSMEFRQSVL